MDSFSQAIEHCAGWVSADVMIAYQWPFNLLLYLPLDLIVYRERFDVFRFDVDLLVFRQVE